MIQNIDLFVYSGTGNTWKAAACICLAAEAQGVACSILPIDANSMPKEYCPRADHLLGLMAPTLGAIQPWSFFRFLARLPRGNRQSVFLAATGAWTKIGRLFVPGFIGFGLYLAALILLIKGYRIAGIDGFVMPHNWTTLITHIAIRPSSRSTAKFRLQPVRSSPRCSRVGECFAASAIWSSDLSSFQYRFCFCYSGICF